MIKKGSNSPDMDVNAGIASYIILDAYSSGYVPVRICVAGWRSFDLDAFGLMKQEYVRETLHQKEGVTLDRLFTVPLGNRDKSVSDMYVRESHQGAVFSTNTYFGCFDCTAYANHTSIKKVRVCVKGSDNPHLIHVDQNGRETIVDISNDITVPIDQYNSGYLYVKCVEGGCPEEIWYEGDGEVKPVKLAIIICTYRRDYCDLCGYPRTISLMAKGRTGAAYRHSYDQIRSVVSNFHAIDELGIRCMLAVAANRIFDDPFRVAGGRGDYGQDPVLFDNLALGMYCMAQGLWVNRLTRAQKYNKVLFFSRDGYLPWLAYDMIREHAKEPGPEAAYARCSRKALLPLLLTNDAGPLEAGSHVMYYDHSPRSLTRLMNPVLKEDAEEQLRGQYGAQWEQVFKSENDLVNLMMRLRKEYVDDARAQCVQEGYQAYFDPLMKERILTYDIGYSLRNEIMLRRFFPEVGIDACFTHSSDDVSLRRAAQGDIGIYTFYSSTPYVSWLPRELFLTENAPSCVGYTPEGRPVMNGFPAELS